MIASLYSVTCDVCGERSPPAESLADAVRMTLTVDVRLPGDGNYGGDDRVQVRVDVCVRCGLGVSLASVFDAAVSIATRWRRPPGPIQVFTS